MNTNFQTVHQFGSGISQMVRQATGRDSVESMEMDWVSVEQQKKWVYGEAEGNPAHFITTLPDGIMSLLVGINPVQDLNGYDSPWPAGGGKNKLYPGNVVSGKNLTITKDSSGIVHVSGQPSGTWVDFCSAYSLSIPAGDYVLSIQTALPCTFALYFYYEGDTTRYVQVITAGSTSKVITFTDNVERVYLGLTAMDTETNYDMTIAAQLEAGQQATAYAPYSNICPISGWTECNLTIANGDDDTSADYDSDTFTLEFPDSQTVYGGTLNPITGVLSVEWAMVDLGTLTWASDPNRLTVKFTRSLSASIFKTSPWADAICSEYALKKDGPDSIGNGQFSTINAYGAGNVFFKDNAFSEMTVDEVKEYLSGVQLVYELATPIEIQLDPITIQTFIGDNYISADTGPVSVEYKTEEEVI